MLRLLSIFLLTLTAFNMDAEKGSVSFNVSNPDKNQIYIEGSPSLIVSQALAGYELQSVTDQNCLFTLLTNKKKKQVWVSISPSLPIGVKLYLTIKTDSGALTSGSGEGLRVQLSSTPQVCITNIDKMRLERAPMLFECQTTTSVGELSLRSYVLSFDFI